MNYDNRLKKKPSCIHHVHCTHKFQLELFVLFFVLLLCEIKCDMQAPLEPRFTQNVTIFGKQHPYSQSTENLLSDDVFVCRVTLGFIKFINKTMPGHSPIKKYVCIAPRRIASSDVL